MKYRGSCHCQRVVFEVEGQIDSGLACNCSMCMRRGSLLWFVPRHMLTLLTDDDAAATYWFNKHAIGHRFCPVCGIHAFGEGTDPKGNPIAAVNLRCIENIDLARIPVREFNGRAL